MSAQLKKDDWVVVSHPASGWKCRPESFQNARGLIRQVDTDGVEVKLEEGGTWWFGQDELSSLEANSAEAITLRDQFAMAALTGLCVQDRYFTMVSAVIADDAYKIADAMLSAREHAR